MKVLTIYASRFIKLYIKKLCQGCLFDLYWQWLGVKLIGDATPASFRAATFIPIHRLIAGKTCCLKAWSWESSTDDDLIDDSSSGAGCWFRCGTTTLGVLLMEASSTTGRDTPFSALVQSWLCFSNRLLSAEWTAKVLRRRSSWEHTSCKHGSP